MTRRARGGQSDKKQEREKESQEGQHVEVLVLYLSALAMLFFHANKPSWTGLTRLDVS